MNRKILIIDDDQVTCRILEKVFAKKGYDAQSVHDAGSAVALIRELPVDVSLMDINLPDQKGIELLSYFKKESPHTAVIMITGDVSAETAIQALNEGADAYITKPFNMDYVLQILEQTFEKQRLREEIVQLNEKLRKELDRKIQAEATLTDNLNFIQKLIDTFPSPIFYKDAAGVYQGCNTAFEAYVGKTKDGIIGRTDQAVAPQHLENPFLNGAGAPLTNHGDLEYEATMTFADRSRHHMILKKAFYTDSNGMPAGQFCIMVDITGRKNAEKERLRLSTAIEQARESILITDKNSIIQYVNPAVEKVTGYTREELIGQKPNILSSGQLSPEFYAKMWDTLTRGKVWFGHFINKRKDGSLYEEEASITPVKDSLGNVSNYVAVKRDVTEEVRQHRQLQAAQKMEAIGTLAGGIAHDFNNILAAIMGYSELVQDLLPDESRIRSYFQEINKASVRAKDLVQQILTISRKEEYEKHPVQLHLIIKEVVKLMRATLPSSIEIQSKVAKCGAVLAEATQLHQVMMNLCTNAYHAMTKTGGVLTVTLDEINLKVPLISSQTALPPGRYVKMAVQDTGQGIDERTIGRIFDPYFTTKPKEKGTGLGLSIVYSIVEQHEGTILVRSKPGRGSTFEIFLPVHQDETKPLPVAETEIPKGRESILFVDDEPQLASLGENMLTPLGYSVQSCTMGQEALRCFQERPGHFDLVITDMTMPKMSGIQLANALRNERTDIPIILCTGFSEHVTDDVLRQAGIVKMVMKPLSRRELAGTVRVVLDRENGADDPKSDSEIAAGHRAEGCGDG